MKEVTFPVRVMQQLGIRYLFLSNAAGGLNHLFQMGDVMLITDHINYFPENPLRGKNHSELGERFPDMSEAYDKQLRALVLQISAEKGISLRQGVYVGTSGPSYETPAENAFLPYDRSRCRGNVLPYPKVIRCPSRRNQSRCFLSNYQLQQPG